MNTLRQNIISRILCCLTLFTAFAAPAYSQDVPENTPVEEPYVRSGSQKAIGVTSDVLAVGMPVAAATVAICKQDWTGLKQAAFTALTAGAATITLKLAIHKQRPDHSNFHSMSSGHAADGFATAAFMQRRYGWKFGAPAFALATYIGWARIYAKKHDFWDVLVGAAIGAGAAYIYTRPYKPKSPTITLVPHTDGSAFLLTTTITF